MSWAQFEDTAEAKGYAQIPEFDSGGYRLDERGVYRHTRYVNDSKATLGLKPSTPLRRRLLYGQHGCCADCGVPEWAISHSLQIHRVEPNGLYSVWNTVLICVICHSRRHRGSAVSA